MLSETLDMEGQILRELTYMWILKESKSSNQIVPGYGVWEKLKDNGQRVQSFS